ncbi:hypothetical protein EVAR_85354_1 [Eumeta japonica]|uniref:Uncharacterized protein n=1 Tax=Eumeta variegata TaxID=151549 RepID=A0A4C1WS05_EUMVA|nr:hypothetical protein EVAR_85354_1 [Eumeta japonica]
MNVYELGLQENIWMKDGVEVMEEGASHRNYHSYDEKQQLNLIFHAHFVLQPSADGSHARCPSSALWAVRPRSPTEYTSFEYLLPFTSSRHCQAARRTPHAARRTPHAARRTPHAARRTHSSCALSRRSRPITIQCRRSTDRPLCLHRRQFRRSAAPALYAR